MSNVIATRGIASDLGDDFAKAAFVALVGRADRMLQKGCFQRGYAILKVVFLAVGLGCARIKTGLADRCGIEMGECYFDFFPSGKEPTDRLIEGSTAAVSARGDWGRFPRVWHG